MEIFLTQYWNDRKGDRGRLSAFLNTSIDRRVLLSTPWVRGALLHGECGVSECRRGALEMLNVAIRMVLFMEATVARPRRGRVFWRIGEPSWVNRHSARMEPCGIDHTLPWRDKNGVAFVTTEPYAAPPTESWEGIAWVELPTGYGMWNPPHTKLFLLAKPEHKANIERLRDDLLAFKMPVVNLQYEFTSAIHEVSHAVH